MAQIASGATTVAQIARHGQLGRLEARPSLYPANAARSGRAASTRADHYASSSASSSGRSYEFLRAALLASTTSLALASALADDLFWATSSRTLTHADDTDHDQLHPRGHGPDPRSAKRQGSSVRQFVPEAALMRPTMADDDDPYPMRALAAQPRAIGDQGYALAEKALKVAEGEAERNRSA